MHTYSWDSFGNATTIDGIGITYDAFDRMVEQNNSGSYKQFIYSPTGFKMQIMNGATSLTNFLPLPGGASIVYIASGSYFRHADWLGSSRFSSTSARAMYSDKAYAPFGEPYAQAGATTDLSFTGMNSDTSAGLYDFPAREYSTQGRWPKPDPAGLAAVDQSNPQSWNRYAYVSNSPLGLVDPLGLCQKTKSGFNEHCYSGGIGDGGGCSMDGDTVDCVGSGTMGDPTAVIGGNSIFDAIDGAPGTWYNPKTGGWGWSAPNPSSWAARSGVTTPPANETVYVYCSEFDLSNISCDPPPQAMAGSRTWYSPNYNFDEARIASVGRGVQAGAGGIGDPLFIAGFYGASAGTALLLGPQSIFIGTRYAGNVPLLNSSNYLRFGWSFIRPTGEYVLRIGGDLLEGGHVNLWPPHWWF